MDRVDDNQGGRATGGTGLTRRALLKGALAAGAAVAGAGAVQALTGGGPAGSQAKAAGPSGAPGPGMPTPDRWVYTTCGFCGVGCGMEIGVKDGRAVAVRGTADYPVNRGKLCAKGIYEWKVLGAADRATRPLIRAGASGAGAGGGAPPGSGKPPLAQRAALRPASWDEALDLVAGRFREIIEKHGPDAVAIYNTGQLVMEEYYALGKLARAGLGTSRLDGNTRLCMASAVVGHARSFGTDGAVGSYSDFEQADVIMIVGSNTAECHPILFGRIARARAERGTKLIVLDPRITQPARMADYHLALRPGTDVALLNGMLAVLLRDGRIDRAYVDAHTKGFDKLAAHLEKYTPEYTSRITGVPAEQIVGAARLYGGARAALSIWVMGINQSVNGTFANNALHNLALCTGNMGRPGAGSFSITGQPSAMSSREVGGSSSYPGYRAIANEAHRKEIAALWGVDWRKLPDKTPSVTEIFQAIHEGKVRALWVIGTNPGLSMPDRSSARTALEKVDFLVVQDGYHPTDTSHYADVVLPAAIWGEKTGVFTNSERRVNVCRKAVEPPGEARPDFDVILGVGRRMGYGHLFPFRTPEEAFEEIKRVTRGRPNDYTGMTYDRLERMRGIQWPCPSPDHPGTERLYADGRFNTPDGKAVLWALDPIPLPETPGEGAPIWLNTGRVQEHYHTGTKTRKVPELNQLVPGPYVEIHPDDATRLNIQYGDVVTLENRRGRIRAKAVPTRIGAPGAVFVPMHFSEGAANDLTINAVDPLSKEPNFKQAAVRLVRG